MKKRILSFLLALACALSLVALPVAAEGLPTAEIKGHNLLLEDSVHIVYYVDFENIPAGAETGVLIWTNPRDNYTYGTEDEKLSSIDLDYGYQKFVFRGVSAKMMAQDIYAVPYIKLGDKVIYGSLDTYSVLQYALNKKGSTTMVPGGKITLGVLVEELMNYGTVAQLYFGYRLDRLANNLFAGNHGANQPEQFSTTREIIKQAQTMTLEELARKAIEESNGKTFYGVGNSSRGKSALPHFIEYLQSIDSSYNMAFEWQQPKNNKIFDQLTADSKKATGTFAMTLIQDGNQIESKMVQTGVLDTFIPKEWADANGVTADEYDGYLALQTLNKVFMYNCTGSKTYTNVWDFVAEGEHGLYMDIDSELVGKNFLYMLTKDEYAADLKAAYDVLPAAKKAYINKAIKAVEADAETFGLGENGKYALAWIKLWVGSYNAQTDDGPICNTLVDASATDQFGLLVYSKLRSVTETESGSKNNIKVAAYQDGYTGFGGYGYCHYLFVTDNSPLPWTACAFIAFMTCTVSGFSAWGKDMGGYSSNPVVMQGTEERYHHSTRGDTAEGGPFPALNDKGFDWWKDRLVIEDPEYCASVAFTIGSWIELLDKYKGW